MRYDPLPGDQGNEILPHQDPLQDPLRHQDPSQGESTAQRADRRWWWWQIWRNHPAARWGLPLGIVILGGIVVGVSVAAAINIPQVNALGQFTPSLITRVEDRDGEVFAEFARQRRVMLREGEVPPVLRDAIVAVEDAKFFQHGGIDAMGVARALLTNLRTGERGEGASTITMQLARELFLTPAKKWKRKVEEAFTAVELEKRYSKQQILTLYCNLFNLGHGNYGMAQATRYFFDKEVADLELHEAAMLAGIVQRPSDYSPYRRPEWVTERRNWVLKRMLAEGYISQDEYEAAVAMPLGVVRQKRRQTPAPYFAEEIRQYVEQTYGTQQMLEGGLQVQSTLDRQIQDSAETALRNGLLRLDHRKGWRGPLRTLEEGTDLTAVELESWSWGEDKPALDTWYQGVVVAADRKTATVRIGPWTRELDREGMKWTRKEGPNRILSPGDVAWFRFEAEGDAKDDAEDETELRLVLEQVPELEGAMVVLESATGAIRAMVGGWDFERSKFNRVTQGKRQVGSSFKMFVYGTALEAGFTPADTLFDAPTYFLGADNKPSYKPRNYTRQYYGIVTLRSALERSLNMTAVKLMDLVGTDRVIEFAHRCGVESELQPYPSLALGAAEITVQEMAAAYAAVANQGTFVRPYLVQRVIGRNGRSLEEHLPDTRKSMEPAVAYVLTHMMEGVVDRGSGVILNKIPMDLAGKTGTTDDYSDAWFLGFTPRYTMAVWVGYDQPKKIGYNMTGGEVAAPIWKAAIEDGLEKGWLQEGERFAPPPGISLVQVEQLTGFLATPSSDRVIEEAFVTGTEPVQVYEPEWGLIMELPWFQQRPFYLPRDGEPMPEDFAEIARLEALES